MKAIRRDHQVPTMLQTIIVFSLILNRVAAEFYIGEYHHTSVHDSGGRNPIKETNAIYHLDRNDGRTDGSHDDDNEESNELFAARSNKRGGHGQPRQSSAKMEGRSLSAFNPLTPGGTIYLAFIFLIPLTVGKTHLGRGKSSSSLSKSSSSSGLLERLIDKVQQDQQSLYSEMGYVDGNLMLRKGWRDLRDTLAKKLRLLPWRRRFHDNNDDANSQNNRRRKKKKWKSWMDRRNDR